MTQEPGNEHRYNKLIITLSIIIPLAVAALFGSRVKIPGYDFRFLPSVYASINGLTAILLVLAVRAIKRGNQTLHQRLMKTCIGLSATFLVLYVIYHLTTPTTEFGGEGIVKVIYLFILGTHILLSIVIVPLVLFTFSRALNGNFVRHRKLARITYPIWLYVAVTGVVVYLMISPYY